MNPIRPSEYLIKLLGEIDMRDMYLCSLDNMVLF